MTTLSEPTYLGHHPSPMAPRVTGDTVTNQTVEDFVTLLAANPARIRASVQNQGTAPCQIRLGSTVYDLRGATSAGSGDGGSWEDYDYRGEVEIFGEAISYSYQELTR